MSTAWSRLARTRFATDDVEVARDVISRVYGTTAEVRGSGAVAPSALRRAVAYIEAHAEEPIRLRDIAEAAGTNSRSVHYAFSGHLDASPMSYLRRFWLEQAHRDLQLADPATGNTVSAIAKRWGFARDRQVRQQLLPTLWCPSQPYAPPMTRPVA